MKITLKLRITILINLFFLILLFLFNFLFINFTSKKFEQLKENELEILSLSWEMKFLDSELTSSVGKLLQTNDSKWKGQYDRYAKRLDEVILILQKISFKQDLKVIERTAETNNKLIKLEEEIFTLQAKNNSNLGLEVLYGKEYLKNKEIYTNSIEEFFQLQNKRVENYFQDLLNLAYYLELISFVLGCLFILLSSILYYFLADSINFPLRQLLKGASEISKGNLQRSIPKKNSDEFGSITDSINQMLFSLKTLIAKIKHISSSVKEEANVLNKYSGDLSQTSLNQSSASEEISSSMQELITSTETMNHEFQKTNSEVLGINQNTITLESLISNSMLEISGLKNLSITSENLIGESLKKIDSTKNSIDAIQTETSKIEEFALIISEISDQTNLLSLNASIEAARAGDTGKGFAVVATEVTKLADKTKESTGSVKQNLKKTQDSVKLGNQNAGYIAEKSSLLHSLSGNLIGMMDELVKYTDEFKIDE
ncbi:MAG: methyl-accepting chemotaxis protein [Leptospiraceae bacterium]|nr:methyl-accepting chemotaxis protein [Leptospiraceae bacterium]